MTIGIGQLGLLENKLGIQGGWLKQAEQPLTPYHGTGFMLASSQEEHIVNRLTIGRVAKRAGVGVETIRFYERKGLLEEPPRRESGYRQYPEEAVTRVRFIRRAKDLGFSLREVDELLSLRVDRRNGASAVRRRAEAKITDIEHKLADLERIKSVLVELTSCCQSKSPTGDCPILEALEGRSRADVGESLERAEK